MCGPGFLGVAYVTVAEYKVLGLPADALEEVLDSDILAHLDATAGIIDTYLASRYTLPLTTSPEALKRCNSCLASWHILLWRGYNPETFDTGYKEAHDECLEWLRKVGSGELTIPGVEDQTPTIDEGAPGVRSDTLRGW